MPFTGPENRVSAAPRQISSNSARRGTRRRGSVLIEFALVALMLYFFLAVMLSFGRMLWSAQVVQQATEIFAREVSRMPLDANDTFETAMTDPEVLSRVYDPNFLVINISSWIAAPGGLTLLEWLDAQPSTQNMPLVNRALIPVMFIQKVPGIGTVLRYPGALVDIGGGTANPVPTGYIVQVADVVSRDATGLETITWRNVIEEVDSANEPFQVSSAEGGMVAARIYFPFQSATLRMVKQGIGVVSADDTANEAGVTQNNAAQGTPVDPKESGGVYTGTFGLGRRYAQSDEVRPFSRMLVTQAFYRREVFR